MAKKVLVPVLPSDRFYDAVVAAADIVASEGGVVTFVFCEVRPPESVFDDDPDGRPSDIAVSLEGGSGDLNGQDLELWRSLQVSALDEARQMLYERGVDDDRIDYVFADYADSETVGQAIADEADAGAYDLVVLARGYFQEEVDEGGSDAPAIADAIQKAASEPVKLLVA